MCGYTEDTTQLATSLRPKESHRGGGALKTRLLKAALSAGAASVLILAAPTHAQQPADTEAQQVEEITVTGTRIRTPGQIS